ncbi:hypothetical protein CALCODRAFT_519664 [Calocera cornea HHB12733]|uniref:Uncharacterized protein n=1 Tax=Calocera cornea HHB12733 TaxID=1353952 RepID=A0A165E3S3_9BASI|nr:hypothetical protein CALCODRAFT_519664 [Calocera cornea HHB12733]
MDIADLLCEPAPSTSGQSSLDEGVLRLLPPPIPSSRHSPMPDLRSERDNLLADAIELADTLTAMLEQIEPRRSMISTSGRELKPGAVLHTTHMLESKLHRRVQRINERRNDALAPVSRLPDDVLRYIFSVPSAEGWPKWGQFSVLVSHICRRWRVVALDTPRMWASVRYSSRLSDPFSTMYDEPHAWRPPRNVSVSHRDLTHPFWDQKGHDATVHKDSTFLARSKSARLDVELNIFEYPDLEASTVEGYLRRHRYRAGDVSLSVAKYSTGSLKKVMSRLAEDKPMLQLRKLRISSRPLLAQIFDTSMTDLFSYTMPQLHEVHLSNMPLPASFDPTYRLLSACKKLTLHASQESGFSSDKMTALLAGCPDLIEFRLVLDRPIIDSSQASPSRERFVLPKLRFYSACTARWGADIAFSLLRTPALTHLEVQRDIINTNVEREDYVGYLKQYIKASSAPLEYLSVKGLEPASFEEILKDVPSIKYLSFTKRLSLWEPTNSYQTLFRVLLESVLKVMPGEKPNCICPNLEAISCDLLAVPSLVKALSDLALVRSTASVAGKHGIAVIRRIELGDWPPSGMPATPAQAYLNEDELARHVDEFTIGKHRYDKLNRMWLPGACSFKNFLPFGQHVQEDPPFGLRRSDDSILFDVPPPALPPAADDDDDDEEDIPHPARTPSWWAWYWICILLLISTLLSIDTTGRRFLL